MMLIAGFFCSEIVWKCDEFWMNFARWNLDDFYGGFYCWSCGDNLWATYLEVEHNFMIYFCNFLSSTIKN
jgi:hypothetical protein